jgi:hypothetical protein
MYLSLPLNSHIACRPTQPTVQFSPLSPTTQLHTSQSAVQHCTLTFIDEFCRLIRQISESDCQLRNVRPSVRPIPRTEKLGPQYVEFMKPDF